MRSPDRVVHTVQRFRRFRPWMVWHGATPCGRAATARERSSPRTVRWRAGQRAVAIAAVCAGVLIIGRLGRRGSTVGAVELTMGAPTSVAAVPAGVVEHRSLPGVLPAAASPARPTPIAAVAVPADPTGGATFATTLGRVTLGMHRADVLRILGQPGRETVTHGIGSPEWTYANGLTVGFDGPPGRGVWEVIARPPFAGATAEGFRLGDRERRYRDLYQAGAVTAPQAGQLQLLDRAGIELGAVFDANGRAALLHLTNTRCHTCETQKASQAPGQGKRPVSPGRGAIQPAGSRARGTPAARPGSMAAAQPAARGAFPGPRAVAGALPGGGLLAVGPFMFYATLYHDSAIQLPGIAGGAWLASDVVGVGARLLWRYEGAAMMGPVRVAWGPEGGVEQFETYRALSLGMRGGRDAGGLLLPEGVRAGQRAWFGLRLDTPAATYGVNIAFIVRRSTHGWNVADVTVQPFQ